MKNKIISAFFLLTGFTTFAQIDMTDSSAQVISYWNKGDVYDYTITKEKIKIKNGDTTSKQAVVSEVQIKVLKATENSYTVQWLYKDVQAQNQNPEFKKIAKATNNLKVIYKTDELGVMEEVMNWKEIQKHIEKSVGKIKKEMNLNASVEQEVSEILGAFSTKEGIENFVIKEINQFHVFHGAKYTLGEKLEEDAKLPNILGGEPFDGKIGAMLTDIDEEEGVFEMKYWQIIDEDQLLDATLKFLTKIAKSMNAKPPTKDDITELKNETIVIATIHELGWPIVNFKQVTVISSNIQNVEKCTIELK